jgi:hypothetical protein
VNTTIYRSQIVFQKHNLTVTVFCTLHTSGFTRPDRAATTVDRSLDALL